jgi:hypothetical protein
VMKREPSAWGGGIQLGHPLLGEYKSGDLALQFGAFKFEKLIYGHKPCGT